MFRCVRRQTQAPKDKSKKKSDKKAKQQSEKQSKVQTKEQAEIARLQQENELLKNQLTTIKSQIKFLYTNHAK